MVDARDYRRIAEHYVADVLAGRQLACTATVAACQRQRDDRARSDPEAFPFVYDAARGARVCRFLELLPHIKGKWAGTLLVLEPWQVWLVMTVFSWVGAEGTARAGLRRFRTAYIEVPRKSGKSSLTSGVGLYMLALDGEGGADCYSAATTKDQAKIVWSDAHQMAKRSPGFRNRFGIELGAHAITIPATASRFVPLASEDGTLDGLNSHFVALDELHAHKTRGLYDVMETSTGARTQSLLWCITTAGSNRAGICYEVRSYVQKVLDRAAVDESLFGVIYSIDEADDPMAESSWRKANPNYGVSVLADDVARLAKKAGELPSALNNFLTKRLNVWVNADTAWLPAGTWDACADASLAADQFAGEPCWVGIDLASKVDIASAVRLFRRTDADGRVHYTAFARHYLPEETIEQSGNSQYQGWQRAGYLIETPGTVIDQGHIQDDLRADKTTHQLEAVGYDPFQATKFASELLEEGFPMIEVGATVKNFSEPMKEVAALALDGRFHHDGDPVLAWMASNVMCHVDAKENIYPRKQFPQNKIDGIVALLMALARAMHAPAPVVSVYEQRGIECL